MTAYCRRRWDTDDRLVGVADASAFAQGVEELAEPARRPGWVAEVEVVTGNPDGPGPFASHGHSIWLTLTPAAIA
jgi:hypothetical protein